MADAPAPDFGPYLARWRLVPDGAAIATRTSLLLPVRRDGAAAMLKLACVDEEARGGALMAWWDGDGAARVLAHDGAALLLERATGGRSLAALAHAGDDDEATRVLCATAARLHRPRPPAPPSLVPLAAWFRDLGDAAGRGGWFARAASVATALLAEPRDLAVLHGDLHHDNVLDFGARGWLAIDPKALAGERGFDFANLFCNPGALATAPGRLERQATRVAALASLSRARLLHWIVAWAGLSAVWAIEAGDPPEPTLAVAALAAAELERGGGGAAA